MEYTEEQWMAVQKLAQEPADDPSTTSRECLEEDDEEERDETPTDESSIPCGGFGPDITVVVSCVKFRYYLPVLASSSEYFHELLTSGKKQGKWKKVEFPDKDPEEWKQVAKFFEPLYSSKAGKITKDNIDILLPWFDLLKMKHLQKAAEVWILRKCLPAPGTDHILISRVQPGHKEPLPLGSGDTGTISFWKSEVEDLCTTFHLAVVYQFENLKHCLGGIVRTTLIQSPDFFSLESVSTLVSALTSAKMDQETKEECWTLLTVYIPPSVLSSSDRDDVLANPLLPHLILNCMETRAGESRTTRSVLPDPTPRKTPKTKHKHTSRS